MATVRKSKDGKPLEGEIQREICEWLTERGVMFWRVNNIPAMFRDSGGQMKFRSLPKFVPRGLPDIMAVIDKHFIAIEVKRPGAATRPEQAEWGKRLTSHGGDYYIVYSLKEAQGVVGSYL